MKVRNASSISDGRNGKTDASGRARCHPDSSIKSGTAVIADTDGSSALAIGTAQPAQHPDRTKTDSPQNAAWQIVAFIVSLLDDTQIPAAARWTANMIIIPIHIDTCLSDFIIL